MGLDMYLFANQDIYSYTADGARKIDLIVDALDASHIRGLNFGNAKVRIEVAYWRKSNAIHNFFVQLNNGVDDCEPIRVAKVDLENLLERCKEVLRVRTDAIANELLPSVSGFFFGSTEYDEWYYEDLENTVEVLENILTNAPNSWTYEYEASW